MFIQIAASNKELFALNEDGIIYKYIPAHENSKGKMIFAFWTKLTSYVAKDDK